MPSDFGSFYQQYVGNQPSQQVNVPAQPTYRPRGATSDAPAIYFDPVSDWSGLSLFGSSTPPRPPTGRREFYKGNALLNAYNWLLPYTAQTVGAGAAAFGDIYRREGAKSKAYELAQFSEFAPKYAEAILNADPRQAALLEMYNQALGSGLGQAQDYATRLRGGLDQPMSSAAARDITQASLGQSALQGFGQGPRDAALAYIKTGLVGEQLQRQREGDYLNALGQLGQNTNALTSGIQANKSVLGDPFLAFAGRPGQPQGSTIQSPDYGGFNNDLFSYSANMDALRRNLAAAHAAGNQAMIGQIIGSVLGVAGSAVGKGGALAG